MNQNRTNDVKAQSCLLSHFCKYDGDSTANTLRIRSQCIRREFAELGECNAIVRRLHNESINFYHCEMKKLTVCIAIMAEFFVFRPNK